MEQKQNIRIHRIGTLTFGCMLLLFGTLFLVHIFAPQLKYEIIFRCWPCILIALGIEVLVGNYKAERMSKEGQQIQFIYDKGAILLTFFITFFSMVMAVVDFCMQYVYVYENGCIRC